jgi:hypothetical protein
MSKRIGLSTKEYLSNAPLPQQTESYTVIPHGSVMTETEKLLKEKGFSIEREMYKCTVNAQVAQGVYHLKYGSDPEMSMLVAWSNSYDKSMRFKFAVGGYIHSSSSAMLSQNIGNWNRKHTGTADQETARTIREQIELADTHYMQLVADKQAMKLVSVSDKRVAELIGRLYIEKNILNTEQLSIIKAQLKQSSFDYNAPKDSLWCLYNHIAYSLQRAHPKAWMDQQRLIHYFICQEYDITPSTKLEEVLVEAVQEIGNSKQLDLVDVIAEVEEEQVVEALITEMREQKQILKEIVTEQIESLLQEDLANTYTNNIPQEEVPLSLPEQEALLEEIPVKTKRPDPEHVDWRCLDCGEGQDTEAIFYDGQLCEECHTKRNTSL